MFDFCYDKSDVWDSYDECGVTLDLTLLRGDDRGILSFYVFEVPYGWLQRKLRDEFDTSYKMFRSRDSYFEDAEKIYADAEKLGIVKSFKKV